MQQRQGQIAQAQESTETRNLFRALARGEQPGSFQNMMAPRGGVEQPPEYNPTRAQYEYWKQIDPQQAGEIAEDILGQAKEIHEMGDPQAAAQFVEENLGIESRFAGGNQYDLKIQDGNLVRVDASGQQPPLIWRDGQWKPLEGRIPMREESKTGGQLIELYNPQDPSQVKTLRRDAPQVDQLLDQGWRETSRGMSVTVTPEGETRVTTGRRTDTGAMETATKSQLEEKKVQSMETLNRLFNIKQMFRPEYQEIPTRLGIAWDELKERTGLGDLSQEEQQRIEDFSQYQQTALENINKYIKQITGAQMSEQEANRLRKAMPDPGEGPLSGDSPTAFKSKLNNTLRKMAFANARYNYWLNNRDKLDSKFFVDLNEMPQFINEIGSRIERDVRSQHPQWDETEVQAEVKRRLQETFGINFGGAR
jgi:hypothetical protein